MCKMLLSDLDKMMADCDPDPVERFVLNSKDYADVQRQGRSLLDVETHTSSLQRGLVAYYHGVSLEVSRRVKAGSPVAVTASGRSRPYCVEHRTVDCLDPDCAARHVLEG